MTPAGDNRPVLIDLFCGQGGCSRGYDLAGFAVGGVDSEPQPRYPYAFWQADALAWLEGLGADDLEGIAAFHASPPCKAYTALQNLWRREHPRLIEPVREALMRTGKPFVIENVPGAPLIDADTLCAGGLGLGTGGRHLQRHRLFECPGFGLVPPCSHFGHEAIGVYGGGAWDQSKSRGSGGYKGSAAESAAAMGIDWMSRDGLAQAIPPAMTEYVGQALLAQLARDAAPAFDAIDAPVALGGVQRPRVGAA
jgi:DNA (cytosine-5)-methyltransferase 1